MTFLLLWHDITSSGKIIDFHLDEVSGNVESVRARVEQVQKENSDLVQEKGNGVKQKILVQVVVVNDCGT